MRTVPFVVMPPERPGISYPPPESDPAPPPRHRRPPVQRDLALLVPEFRVRVEAMRERLRAEGYRPKVWETLRTPERGAWLQEHGRSKNGVRSMHLYGAAVDVICACHRWDCHKHGCGFFEALGKAARDQRLYWGGDWRTFVDRPHVQAIAVRQQNRVRRGESVAGMMRPA